MLLAYWRKLIVERAYDRRRGEVGADPLRESSIQGESVPRARRLRREGEE
jgi:hypothetical protein